MTALLFFALAAAPAAPGVGGLAPLGPSLSGQGDAFDLVARPLGPIVPGRPVALRLLASDAATDAPAQPSGLSVALYGPKGVAAKLDLASEGEPGRWRASWTPAAPGGYSLVARGQDDLVAVDGIAAAVPAAPPPRRPSSVVLALFALGALALFGAMRLFRPLPAALALAFLAAGDARAHGTFVPAAAAVPGAQAFVPQEIQFALGFRTAPAGTARFEPPPGSGLAAREELAVPLSALVEREGRKLVFVRTAPETFVAREPKLGWRGGGKVALVSGVVAGEKVVVEGAAFLRNGGSQG